MHFLHRELDENRELAGIVNTLSEAIASNTAKIALLLDLNPLWLAAFRLDDAGLETDWLLRPPFFPYDAFHEPWDDYALRMPRSWPDWYSHHVASVLGHDATSRVPELDRRYTVVDVLSGRSVARHTVSRMQPYLLRIVVRPDAKSGDRERLREIARNTPILTVIETGSMPRLVSPYSRHWLVRARGLPFHLAAKSAFFLGTMVGRMRAGTTHAARVRSRSSWGTLGGYLQDRKSQRTFGATCGHVVDGSTACTVRSYPGQVVHCAGPTPLRSGEYCHSGSRTTTDLDLALIESQAQRGNGGLRIADRVSNGQIVSMNGAASGLRTYQIGAAVVTHEIGNVCWSNLYQISAPLRGILPEWARLAITKPPKKGDSGAWLIREDNKWVGMVVAADSRHGYALSASEVVTKANRQFGVDLTVY